VGRDWDDSDLCLEREDGEWSLQGPDGVIEVHGFGFLGTITARNVTAAAPAVEELTGRTVTDREPDESSRSRPRHIALVPVHANPVRCQ
jgi:hypothetical protein